MNPKVKWKLSPRKICFEHPIPEQLRMHLMPNLWEKDRRALENGFNGKGS